MAFLLFTLDEKRNGKNKKYGECGIKCLIKTIKKYKRTKQKKKA